MILLHFLAHTSTSECTGIYISSHKLTVIHVYVMQAHLHFQLFLKIAVFFPAIGACAKKAR